MLGDRSPSDDFERVQATTSFGDDSRAGDHSPGQPDQSARLSLLVGDQPSLQVTDKPQSNDRDSELALHPGDHIPAQRQHDPIPRPLSDGSPQNESRSRCSSSLSPLPDDYQPDFPPKVDVVQPTPGIGHHHPPSTSAEVEQSGKCSSATHLSRRRVLTTVQLSPSQGHLDVLPG